MSTDTGYATPGRIRSFDLEQKTDLVYNILGIKWNIL